MAPDYQRPRQGVTTNSQHFPPMQYELLEGEGVVFSGNRIDLDRFHWRPEDGE